jgi:hypothetical protein
MSLDIPVFNLKGLKRSFYYFLTFNIVVVVLGVLCVGIFDHLIDHTLLYKVNSWLILFVLFAGSYVFSSVSKKELKSIIETEDFGQKFSRYERFYKKKLVWNGFSVLLSTVFWVLTIKNFFFYILIFQLILTAVFYPTKKLLSRELKNNEILFT